MNLTGSAFLGASRELPDAAWFITQRRDLSTAALLPSVVRTALKMTDEKSIDIMSKPMQSSFGWGGKRTGAGRKPGRMTKDVRKHTAGAILNAIDEIEEWKTLLQSKNERSE